MDMYAANMEKRLVRITTLIEDKLVSSILADIELILANVKEQSLISKLEKKMKKEFEHFNNELSFINRQIDDIGKQKTKLIQLLANEVITHQDYREVINQNEINLKNHSQTKSEIELKLSNNNASEQFKKAQKELSLVKKIDTLTPDSLHRLIERIEIKADRTARIFYRFSLFCLLFFIAILATRSTPHDLYAETYLQVEYT